MTSPERLYTVEEYLAHEEFAEGRHEYVNGRIYPMAGAEPAHELICTSVSAALVVGTRGQPCFVFGSNMRLHVAASDLYTYPEVSGLCGRPQFAPTRPQTLLNPSFIVEVLSPSTEAYDRGAKFEHYRIVPSLAEYVLIAPGYKSVERYVRDGTSWRYQAFTRTDELVELPSIAVALRVGDVYERVDALDGPPKSPPTPRLVREPVTDWGAAV